MFYFNLLVKNINFHVPFGLLLLKSAFQGLFEKKGPSRKKFGTEIGVTISLSPFYKLQKLLNTLRHFSLRAAYLSVSKILEFRLNPSQQIL